MAFADIPIRQNGKDHLVAASWWNTIRTELINAFGLGGYIKEAALQTLSAAGEITLDSAAFKPMVPVESDGGEVILSSTPFGTSHGFTGGKEIVLLGTDDTNYPVLENNDIADGLYLNGKIELKKGVLVTLIYSGVQGRFYKA